MAFNFSVTLPSGLTVAVIRDSFATSPLCAPDNTGTVSEYLRLVVEFLVQLRQYSPQVVPTLVVIRYVMASSQNNSQPDISLVYNRRIQHQSSTATNWVLQGPMQCPNPGLPYSPPIQPSVPQPHPPAAHSQNPNMRQAYYVWSEYFRRRNEYPAYLQQHNERVAAYDRWVSYQGRDHVTVSVTTRRNDFDSRTTFKGAYHLIPRNNSVTFGLETFTQAVTSTRPHLRPYETQAVYEALDNNLGPVDSQGRNGDTIR